MWNLKHKTAYFACVWDLLEHPDVNAMRNLPQHAKGFSCFHHSVLVSYWSFVLCRRLGLDARAAARGGLLHDLYLYDWQVKGTVPKGRWHGTWHPKAALQNASERFDLSAKEKDIIVKHMFPVTPIPYRYWESLWVSCVDKACAVAEVLHMVPSAYAFDAPAALTEGDKVFGYPAA